MTDATPPNRCRIVLIAPLGSDAEALELRLGQALSGGDVASVILPDPGLGEAAFQALAERVVPVIQAAGAAAIVAGDTRIAVRVNADGVHIEEGRSALADAVERLQGRMAVGIGGIKTRDDALDLGESRPDYVFFGKFGYDNKPEPHPRNLNLGRWWAEMIALPCIVMAGSDLASIEAVAATGADFVALSSAVFGDGIDPRAAVAEANALLDRTAPRFEDAA
jgi:thiamine-phosphate pyrophosphorylase